MRTKRSRDTQRSRVYKWERAATEHFKACARFESLDDCEAFVRPIWRSERGRYGRENTPAPLLSRNLWGQRRATASVAGDVIKLPKWSRNDWVILHEMAHCLCAPKIPGGAHGSRFVGCLIGLAARHLGRDADELMALADEMGVRYDRRSVGAVPVRSNGDRLLALLPCTVMRAAVELDCSYRTIHGYALGLIRRGAVRYFRGKLVRVAA